MVLEAQLAQPLTNGAIVLALETDFDGCMKTVEEVSSDPRFYLANSKNSLRIEGQKTLAVEIVEQLRWEPPDWIVIPCGNLGNVSALGKGLIMMKQLGLTERLPRILAAQAESANPLYRSYLPGYDRFEPEAACPTLATSIGIGDPVSYERAVKVLRELDGVVSQASEQELADASARANLHGLYTCPQTGVALACLLKATNAGIIGADDRVVVISTAHGLKFPQFKRDYHSGKLGGVASRPANPPVELPADYDAVVSAIRDRIEG